jgi:hypothetical protein
VNETTRSAAAAASSARLYYVVVFIGQRDVGDQENFGDGGNFRGRKKCDDARAAGDAADPVQATKSRNDR